MDEAQSCEGCLCLDNRHIHLMMMKIMWSIIMMIVIINDDSDNCGGGEAENDINDEKGSEAQRWQIQWQSKHLKGQLGPYVGNVTFLAVQDSSIGDIVTHSVIN